MYTAVKACNFLFSTQVFNMIRMETMPASSQSESVSSEGDESIPSPSMEDKGDLDWTPWKTGMAFSYSGRTLMIIKQESSEPSDDDADGYGGRLGPLPSFLLPLYFHSTSILLPLCFHSASTLLLLYFY